MKTFRHFLLTLALLAAAGCASTPTDRVAAHKAAYSQWPADVQANVAAGRIAVGYTAEQVRVALGDPARTFARVTADGTSEIWAYADNPPRFSIGLGIGSWGRSSAVGGGIGVSSGGFRDGERMHVIFANGRVSAIESSQR
jgi:hypothetical protein